MDFDYPARTLELSGRLGAFMREEVAPRDEEWRALAKIRRLWQHDKSVWTGTDEDKWLGWLDITEQQLEDIDKLKEIAADIKQAKKETPNGDCPTTIRFKDEDTEEEQADDAGNETESASTEDDDIEDEDEEGFVERKPRGHRHEDKESKKVTSR